MLVQDSHRSAILFQLRDWRESLATSPATWHGLPGELKYQFKTNATPPLQISRCDSSQTSGLDENLAKEQSLEARLAATGRVSLRSGVLFSVVTKRTADRRLSRLVVTSHSPSLLLDPSPLSLPWAEIIILRSLKLYVSYNYLFSFSSLSRNCVKIEAISVFVIFWERK